MVRKWNKIFSNQEEDPPVKRVLVVDDEEGILLILKDILEDFGYVVEMAQDGKEALKKIKKKNFNYIFTDMNMPVMSGKALIKKIRTDENLPQPMVIALTGGFQVDEEQAETLWDGFLLKPFNENQLKRILYCPYTPKLV